MNNQKFTINSDTLKLLLISNEICERQGIGYISELAALGALSIMEDSPFHRYFLKKGLTEEKITENVKKLFEKYPKALCDPEADFKIIELFYPSGLVKELVISETLFNIIIKAGEIGRNSYKSNFVTNAFMQVAFSELMPDIYDDFINLCLGKETENLIKILAKATKKNAILVGPPGVGKTSFGGKIYMANCNRKMS